MGEHDEDMTYTGAEPTRAQLAARVAELERENAELRARLDAVPVEAIRKITFEDARSFGVIRAEQTVAGWLATFDTQPADDTDAPLKLATVEDGE